MVEITQKPNQTKHYKIQPESKKHSILPTNLTKKFHSFLLLAGRGDKIMVLNLTILLALKVNKAVGGWGKHTDSWEDGRK